VFGGESINIRNLMWMRIVDEYLISLIPIVHIGDNVPPIIHRFYPIKIGHRF
jgi:hypothetical protein